MRHAWIVLGLSCTLPLLGAGCSALVVTHHKGTSASPSNVASLFSVERRDGKPLGKLSAGDVEIYESNQRVAPGVTRQTLVDPGRVVGHYTLLLLDLGLCDLEQRSLQAVIEATGAFVERLSGLSKIAIYGFDGSDSLTRIAGFTQDGKALRSALAALEQARPRDPSTDIHGSVVKAVAALQQEMKRSAMPVRWGSMVLLASSKDHARRVPRERMLEVLDEAKIQRYALGVGEAVDTGLLGQFGTEEFHHVNLGTEPKPVVTEEDRQRGVTPEGPPDRPLLSTTLEQLARTLRSRADTLHVLSYCTPLRAGEHHVRVKITQGQLSGEFVFRIDASGFGPGCDPNKIPTF